MTSTGSFREHFLTRRATRNAVLALAGASLVVATISMTQSAALVTSRSTSLGSTATAAISTNCPWVAQSLNHSASASALAGQVVARMTPSELANFVVLRQQGPIENINVGVPRLCIPAITHDRRSRRGRR